MKASHGRRGVILNSEVMVSGENGLRRVRMEQHLPHAPASLYGIRVLGGLRPLREHAAHFGLRGRVVRAQAGIYSILSDLEVSRFRDNRHILVL